jgi:LysR family transcriptional regulator, glycine cleavage system transcriptional activator
LGLSEETLLLDEVDNCWPEWLEGAGIAGVNPPNGPSFAHCELAISAAERDQGVALAYRALVEDDLDAGRLVKVFAHETRDKVIYSVAYPKNRRFSSKILAFRDWIFEEMARAQKSKTLRLSAVGS